MDDFTKLIDRAKKTLNWDALTAFQRTETLLHPHQCSAQIEGGQAKCPCDCLCLTRDQLKEAQQADEESSAAADAVIPSNGSEMSIKRESTSPTISEVISLQVESSDPLPSSTWLAEAANLMPERTVRHSDANINADLMRLKKQKCLKCHHTAEDHLTLVKNVLDQEELLITFLFLKDIKLLKNYEAAEPVPSAAKRVFTRLKEVLESLINHNNSQIVITMPLSLNGQYAPPPFETPSIEYLLFNMISRHSCEFAPFTDAFRIVRRVITFLNKLELPRPESVYTQAMTYGERRLYESFYEHWLVYCHLPRVTGTFKQHRLTTIFGIRFLTLLWDAVLQFFEKTVIVEGDQTMVPVMSATACSVLSTNYCHFFDVAVDSLFYDHLEATRQNYIRPTYLRLIKGSIMSSNSPLVVVNAADKEGSVTLEVNFTQERKQRFVPTFRGSKDSFCRMQGLFDDIFWEPEKVESSPRSSRISSELSSRLSSLSEASNVNFRNVEQSQGSQTPTMVNGSAVAVAATAEKSAQSALTMEAIIGNNSSAIEQSENVFRQLICDVVNDSVNGAAVNGGESIGDGQNIDGQQTTTTTTTTAASATSSTISTLLATNGTLIGATAASAATAIAIQNGGVNGAGGASHSPILASLMLEGSLLPAFNRSRLNEPHRCLTAAQLHQHMLEQRTVSASVSGLSPAPSASVSACSSPSQSSTIASSSTSSAVTGHSVLTSTSATFSACRSIGQLAAGAADHMGVISDLLVRQARRVSQKISAYTSMKSAQLDAASPFQLDGLATHKNPPLQTNTTVVITVSSSEVAFTESEDDDLVVRSEGRLKNVVSFVSLDSPTLCYCHFSQILDLVVETKQLVTSLESHLLKPLLEPGGFAEYCKRPPRGVPPSGQEKKSEKKDNNKSSISSGEESAESGADSGVEQTGGGSVLEASTSSTAVAKRPELPLASFHLSALQRCPHISYVLGLRTSTDKREPNLADIDHPMGYNALVEAKGFFTFLIRRIITYMQLVVSHCDDVNLELVEDVADFVFFDGPFQPFISGPADVAIKSLFYDTLSRRCHAIIRALELHGRPAVSDEPRLGQYLGLPHYSHYSLLSIRERADEAEVAEIDRLMADIAQAQAAEQAAAAAAQAAASSSSAGVSPSLEKKAQKKGKASSSPGRGRPKKRSLESGVHSSGNASCSSSPAPSKGKRTVTPTKAASKAETGAKKATRKEQERGRRGGGRPKKLKRSESLTGNEEGEESSSSSSSSAETDTQTELERSNSSNSSGGNTTATTSASELSKAGPSKSRRKRSVPTSKSMKTVAPKKRRRRKAVRLTLKRRKASTSAVAAAVPNSSSAPTSFRSRRPRRYQLPGTSSSSSTSALSRSRRSTASMRSTSGEGSSDDCRSSSSASSSSSDEESQDSDDSIGFGRVLRKSARIRNAILRERRRRDQEGYVSSSDDSDDDDEEEDVYIEEEVDDGSPPKRKPWDYLDGVTACYIHRDHFPLVMAPNSSRKDPKPWYTFGMGKSIRSEYVKRKQLLFMEVQEVVRVCLPNMLPEFVNQYMFAEGTKTLVMIRQKRVFCCTVFKPHPEAGYCEIVYCTTSRQMQGKGFGRAMLNIVKRYCLDRGIPKLLVMGDKDNHQFFVKCNFTDEITVPEELYEGELCDCTAAVLLECIIEEAETLPVYPMLFENELARLDDPTEKEMMEAAEAAVAAVDTTGMSRRAAEKLRRTAFKQELLRRRRQFADLPPVSDADWYAMNAFLKKYSQLASAEGVDRLSVLTEDYQEQIHLADRIYDRFRCVPTWEVVCRRHQSRHYRSIGMLYYDMVMMIRAIIISVRGKKQRARAAAVHELSDLFDELVEEFFPEVLNWQL